MSSKATSWEGFKGSEALARTKMVTTGTKYRGKKAPRLAQAMGGGGGGGGGGGVGGGGLGGWVVRNCHLLVKIYESPPGERSCLSHSKPKKAYCQEEKGCYRGGLSPAGAQTQTGKKRVQVKKWA